MLEIALLFLRFSPRQTKKLLAKSAWCEANTDMPATLLLNSSSLRRFIVNRLTLNIGFVRNGDPKRRKAVPSASYTAQDRKFCRL
jgi:hypothetical protein